MAPGSGVLLPEVQVHYTPVHPECKQCLNCANAIPLGNRLLFLPSIVQLALTIFLHVEVEWVMYWDCRHRLAGKPQKRLNDGSRVTVYRIPYSFYHPKDAVMKPNEIIITMRDGVRLQNFLYLPPGEGPFPVLLARCMYGADRLEDDARSWAERGYSVLLQNIRGRHGSEGGPVGRNDCAEDGYDTMEWLVAQPWCNRRIGTFGRSALARVQVATAFLAHPAHLAMAPTVLPYGMMSRLGGAIMFSQIPQWMYLAQSGPELNPVETVDWMPHLFKLPVTTVLDELGGPLDQYRAVVTDAHRVYFSDPLRPEPFKALQTPNLMVTGWYDHCGTGPVDFFMHTMEHATEEQRRNTHLIIGPWDHSVAGDEAHEYDFGPHANLDHPSIEVAFFEHHLKGRPPAEPLAPVKIFVMGRNEWRDEQEWPLSRARR